MQRPSESQLESLKKAVTRYHQALPGSVAEEYLDQRGLAPERVSNLRFGFVKDRYQNMLSTRESLLSPICAGTRVMAGPWYLSGSGPWMIRSLSTLR